MAMATVTSKGQVTIPKEVRDSLNLHPGDKIEITLTGNTEALIRPISKKVDELFGVLHRSCKRRLSVGEMDAIVRGKVKESC